MEEKTKLIVDDTSIYEVDMECFSCLSEQERKRYYGDANVRDELEEGAGK